MDYTAIVNQALVFPMGSSTGSSQCINVNVVNDVFREDSEIFFVTLASDDPRTILIPDTAQIEIPENDDGIWRLY